MKHTRILFALIIATASLLTACHHSGTSTITDSVSQDEMAAIYETVKTPYKYGLVIAPQEGATSHHMMDSPTVFSINGKWYMTYIVFDSIGYETCIATSDDLLHWTTIQTILARKDAGWDHSQVAGYAALVDIEWGGTYELEAYNNLYWMTYLGGEQAGYETRPLSIGMAVAEHSSNLMSWRTFEAPVLSPKDSSAQWFEKETQYKSAVFRDKQRHFGHDFVMFYNAFGYNPENGIGAERIGIALSDNMTDWTRYDGNPVVAHEEEGTISGDAHIQKIGDLYVMFYFRAFSPDRPYKAYNTFACSRDLVHWYDWQGDDLIYPTEDYDARYAHKSYLVNHNGITYHYYCAVNNKGQRAIAVATSKDLGKSEITFPNIGSVK